MAETVGFIGLGVMGKTMAKHLIQKGYRLAVHNRSRGPVAELTALGADPCDRPVAVAEASDVIITMLPDTPDVEMVLTGHYGVLSDSATAGGHRHEQHLPGRHRSGWPSTSRNAAERCSTRR
jgi:3-hydroxyisobutyrate dehydrogenase-like beta-hydroxyacid dehydrogenase